MAGGTFTFFLFHLEESALPESVGSHYIFSSSVLPNEHIIKSSRAALSAMATQYIDKKNDTAVVKYSTIDPNLCKTRGINNIYSLQKIHRFIKNLCNFIGCKYIFIL